jgi:hypothetical protein
MFPDVGISVKNKQVGFPLSEPYSVVVVSPDTNSYEKDVPYCDVCPVGMTFIVN